MFETVISTPYARIFDATNPYWSYDEQSARIFFQLKQNYLNERLQTRGYVFLNDVYEALGFPRTGVGVIMGWLKSDDCTVEFHVIKLQNSAYSDHAFALDFNVQGIIYDKI